MKCNVNSNCVLVGLGLGCEIHKLAPQIIFWNMEVLELRCQPGRWCFECNVPPTKSRATRKIQKISVSQKNVDLDQDPTKKVTDGRDWTVQTKNSRRLRLSYYLSSFMINSARCDSSCNSRWWDTCRRGCPNLCYVETNHVARSCHVMKRQGKWAHLPVISTFPTFSNSSFCCISIICSFLNWLSCPCL